MNGETPISRFLVTREHISLLEQAKFSLETVIPANVEPIKSKGTKTFVNVEGKEYSMLFLPQK